MYNKSFFMCSCHLEIIITLKLYDLSSAISKFDVHILTSKTSEISNVNNTMDAMEQELLMGPILLGPKCWDPPHYAMKMKILFTPLLQLGG